MASATHPAPLVLGHRGASAIERENTVAAFRAADEAGAHGVELDVRFTSDDVVVVHHSPAIAGFGTISSEPFERLRIEQAHVPTLDEAVAACGDMVINIEIKNNPAEPGFDPDDRMAGRVVSWVTDHQMTGRVLVSSFNRDTVDAVRTAAPAIPTGQLVNGGAAIDDWIRSTAERGHQWLLPYRRHLERGPDVVAGAHAAGLQVGVWTVDAAKWLQRFADMGVDAVITNDPGRALALYAV